MDSIESVKEAFAKVKKDISNLREQLISLTKELLEIKRTIAQNPTQELVNTTDIGTTPTDDTTDSDTPTHNLPLYSLKSPNYNISIGNNGVPTDRQTDRQTNRHTLQAESSHANTSSTSSQIAVSDLMNSIDFIKNDLKTKFKLLTKQEMLVFCTIYQLEDERFVVDYSLLSAKLKLSESSARDYVFKIVKKAPLIEKIKENNKKVSLKIPQDIRKIASLQAILSIQNLA